MKEQVSADPRAYGFACFRSMVLHRESGARGSWVAPGYTIDTPFDEMPNNGTCFCGATFFVSDVYRYVSFSGVWHGRGECIP